MLPCELEGPAGRGNNTTQCKTQQSDGDTLVQPPAKRFTRPWRVASDTGERLLGMRVLALGLTVLTGFSGLVYEVVWQKYLATLLGSHSEATAAILALFLGGLSVGYALFGWVTRRCVERAAAGKRVPPLFVVYGSIEAAIGVWALCFPVLFSAVQALSVQVPHGAPAVSFCVDVAFAALLLLPPTILMGGTIPILTQALAHDLQDATRFHAFVYAFNTAGAFVGALAAAFLLIPALGLRGTLAAMGGVNLAAGAGFLWAGLNVRARQPTSHQAAPATSQTVAPRTRNAAAAASATSRAFLPFAVAAFLCGFAMMCMQTVLNRLGGLAFGASHFTFAMVVATFVLSIALGSFAVSMLPRIHDAAVVVAVLLLAAVLAGLDRFWGDLPYWSHTLRARFGHEAGDFMPFWRAAFGWMLLLLLVPIGLSGAVLPLLFHVIRRRIGELGSMAGRLYSWNTAGSVLGAFLGGYVLLFWVDLHAVYRVAVVVLTLAAALLGARLLHGRARAAAWAAVAAVLLGLGLQPAWNPLHLSSGPFRARGVLGPEGQGPAAFFKGYDQRVSVLFYDDDPTTSVAVWEGKHKGAVRSRAIVNNGKSDGEIPTDNTTMIFAGMLPALLARECTSSFVIGFGTGVTVGELAALPVMTHVDVAEIASGVLRAAPFFAYGNQQAATNPKVRCMRTDAYRALVRSTAAYDIIASEPSNPWVSGVEMLYSREFLTAAHDRLAPGGVYAQWFHLYETDTATVSMVLRTYCSVFDQVAVWHGMEQDLILLGFRDADPSQHLGRLMQRAGEPAFAAALARAGVTNVPALLAHEVLPLGVLQADALPGPLHTLYRPRLSDLAARAFFRGEAATLPPLLSAPAVVAGEDNSLVRRFTQDPQRWDRKARVASLAETFKYRPAAGVTLLAEWAVEEPNSADVQAAFDQFWRAKNLSQGTDPSDIARLEALLSGDVPAVTSLASARRAAQLFEAHFLYAFPFQRSALAQYWDHAAGGERGSAERRAVEARLGSF